jgi:hypothetical protein
MRDSDSNLIPFHSTLSTTSNAVNVAGPMGLTLGQVIRWAKLLEDQYGPDAIVEINKENPNNSSISFINLKNRVFPNLT